MFGIFNKMVRCNGPLLAVIFAATTGACAGDDWDDPDLADEDGVSAGGDEQRSSEDGDGILEDSTGNGDVVAKDRGDANVLGAKGWANANRGGSLMTFWHIYRACTGTSPLNTSNYTIRFNSFEGKWYNNMLSSVQHWRQVRHSKWYQFEDFHGDAFEMNYKTPNKQFRNVTGFMNDRISSMWYKISKNCNLNPGPDFPP